MGSIPVRSTYSNSFEHFIISTEDFICFQVMLLVTFERSYEPMNKYIECVPTLSGGPRFLDLVHGGGGQHVVPGPVGLDRRLRGRLPLPRGLRLLHLGLPLPTHGARERGEECTRGTFFRDF